MLGRGLSFAQPDILDTVRTRFVPVAIDDWYARRERTADGEFFRRIADQGPKQAGDFDTRQGLYIATSDGLLLAYKNRGDSPEMTRELLADGLKRWGTLGEVPNAEPTPDAGDDPRYQRVPLAGGLVLGVRQRRLARTAVGYGPGTPDKPGGQLAMRQTIWFKPDEWRDMVPPPSVGAAVNIPHLLRARLARFHAADVTQGNGEFWPRSALGTLSMTARTVGVYDDAQVIRYDGQFELKDGSIGRCVARLRGEATFHRPSGKFSRFEWVMVCEIVQADGTTTTHASLFRLPDPVEVADRLPPDGLKSPDAYWRNGE